MARRRSGLDVMEDIIEKAVETVFDRGADLFERNRDRQVAAMPAADRAQIFFCIACREGLLVQQMEMVNPGTPFGMCRTCFAFVWKAGQQKVKFLAKKAAEARVGSPPPAPMPWDILGVSRDASEPEIRKAWKQLAVKYHPDRIPPGSPPEATVQATERFDEVTRARDTMLKLLGVF